MAGKDAADLDFLDAGFDDAIGDFAGDELIAGSKDDTGTRIDDIMHRIASDDPFLESTDDGVLGGVTDLTDFEAVVGVAIVFPDDDVLGNVD